MPMKLCAKAIALRDGYSTVSHADRVDKPVGEAMANSDKRAMVRALNKHMGRCKMCSK